MQQASIPAPPAPGAAPQRTPAGAAGGPALGVPAYGSISDRFRNYAGMVAQPFQMRSDEWYRQQAEAARMKQGADIEGAGGAAAAAAGYQGYPAGPAEPYYPQAAPPGRLTPRDPRKYSLCMGIVAWSLFVLGFFFPFIWIVLVLLPCCVRDLHIRRAAVVSGVFLLVYAIIAIVLPITLTLGRG